MSRRPRRHRALAAAASAVVIMVAAASAWACVPYPYVFVEPRASAPPGTEVIPMATALGVALFGAGVAAGVLARRCRQAAPSPD